MCFALYCHCFLVPVQSGTVSLSTWKGNVSCIGSPHILVIVWRVFTAVIAGDCCSCHHTQTLLVLLPCNCTRINRLFLEPSTYVSMEEDAAAWCLSNPINRWSGSCLRGLPDLFHCPWIHWGGTVFAIEYCPVGHYLQGILSGGKNHLRIMPKGILTWGGYTTPCKTLGSSWHLLYCDHSSCVIGWLLCFALRWNFSQYILPCVLCVYHYSVQLTYRCIFTVRCGFDCRAHYSLSAEIFFQKPCHYRFYRVENAIIPWSALPIQGS